jgi:REP element-mobilizing transposase RayT
MGSTYASLHYHIVFSTKNRTPLIDRAIRERLHEYIGGTVRKLGGIPCGVGGVEDHVHLLIGLKPSHCLADVVRELKKGSTKWARTELGISHFAWQEGYSVFSVSSSAIEAVKAYIASQEEHHRRKSFREEVADMLQRAGVEYDPKYLD